MNEAQYTATGVFFDIGITTRIALQNFMAGEDPLMCGLGGEWDNGNGSLMRIFPAALYCQYKMPAASLHEKISLIHNISALTHAHPRSKMGCGIYSFVLWALFADPTHNGVKNGLSAAFAYYSNQPEYAKEVETYQRVFQEDFSNLPEEEIKSTGYVAS